MRAQLDYDPRPLVEEHYHVRELIDSQEYRSRERQKYRDLKQQQEQAYIDIASFKEIETLDFYCERCKVDFIARARRQLDSWGLIAYYKTKHRCHTWCIRHITDRFRDVYFARSKRIAFERIKRRLDALQPFETGYDAVYRKH